MDRTEKHRVFVTMNATFKDEEKCRAAMETIVNDAHAAYGVTSHCWFRSEDGESLFVVEQYADGRALRKAVMRFTSARMAFFRSIKVTDVSIYGDVSFGIKAMFSPLRPKHMNYYGGYSKTVVEAEEVGIKGFERNRVFVATNATLKNEQKSRKVMEGMVEATYPESGASSHFWTKSKDSEALFVLEQYVDENALLDHLAANPTSRAAILESAEVDDVTIYGAESDKIKEIFASVNPTYMNYYGGYSK